MYFSRLSVRASLAKDRDELTSDLHLLPLHRHI